MSFLRLVNGRIKNLFFIFGFVFMAHASFAQCNNVGFISLITASFGICDPNTDQFTLTVDVDFLTLSPGGILTVTATNASGTYNQTIPGPYVIGTTYTFSIPNIAADGSPITVSAFFSNSVPCGLTVNGTSPATCICTADAGTYAQSLTGSSTPPAVGNYQYQLCFGDVLTVIPNGDYLPPQDFTVGWTPPPAPVYSPSIYLMQYSCSPTITPPGNMLADPCFVGTAAAGILGGINIPNNTGSNQTIFYVPTTMYSTVDNTYAVSINGGQWCYDQGPVYEVTYLSQIVGTTIEDCNLGTATATITGGMPAFNNSNFNVVPGSLVPANAVFNNTTCGNGGTIVISGLINGDNYSFDVVDSKNCPATITGTFVGPAISTFTYPQPTYCSNDVDPVATLAVGASVGGNFTSAPAGLVINPTTGLIDLSVSTPGSYVVTYNATNSVCPSSTDVPITINQAPTISTIDITICANTSTFFGSQVIPGGTYNYAWTVPAGVPNPGNTGSAPASVAGNYSVQATDPATLCVSNVSNSVLTVNPIPTVSVADETFCAGTLATLTATPGQVGTIAYNWTVPAGVPPPGNVASFTTNVVGQYSVQIVGVGNCSSASETAMVTVDAGPTLTINDSTFCTGGNAILTATPNVPGTYTYAWTVPAGAIDPGNANTISTGVAGAYDVQITDVASGCTSPAATGVISINPLPTVVVNNPTICAGASANVSAMPGAIGTYSFAWTVPAGALPPGDISNFTTTVAGTYDVQITDSITGCQSLLSSGNVTVNPIPTVTVNSSTICEGLVTQVIATPTVASSYAYAWTVPAGATDPGNVSFFTIGIDGTYSVVMTDVLTLCSSVSTAGVLTVLPSPIVDGGPDQLGCDTDNYTLTANGAGVGGSYVWSNGVMDGIGFTQLVGIQTYTVTGTTVDGCIGTDDVDIVVDQTPVASFNYVQDGPCAPAEVLFTNTSIPVGTNCIWTFDNGDVVNGCGPLTHVFTEAGTFGVNLQVESILAGCVANNYQASIIAVEDTPIAGFVFSPDELTTLYNEVNFGNTSIGATNYTWDFGDNSMGSTAIDPIHVYANEEPDSYVITLVASTVSGCVDTARALIEIDDELLVYVPNAFTPENNEFNRIFQPVFTSGFEPQTFNLLIFNRWGEVVFQSQDADMGWDGTHGAAGGICQDGVYSWKITFRTAGTNERNILTGHVNLIR